MVSRGMLTTVALRCPGEMCAIMIVSEQLQPVRPPIAALCPDLVSDPSTRMFSALVYLGGRCATSIRLMWVMPDNCSRTATTTPMTDATNATAMATAVQVMIFARRDRWRFGGASGAVSLIPPPDDMMPPRYRVNGFTPHCVPTANRVDSTVSSPRPAV